MGTWLWNPARSDCRRSCTIECAVKATAGILPPRSRKGEEPLEHERHRHDREHDEAGHERSALADELGQEHEDDDRDAERYHRYDGEEQTLSHCDFLLSR